MAVYEGDADNVYSHEMDDGGVIMFRLVQTDELLSYTPREIYERAVSPDTETSIDFYAYLDGTGMSWTFHREMWHPDDDGGDDPGERDLDNSAPEFAEETKARIIADIDAYCRENMGMGAEAAAKRHAKRTADPKPKDRRPQKM